MSPSIYLFIFALCYPPLNASLAPFRFHPLSEFDEGKRSCRRRLAGHNRRRRKTQTEDVSSHTVLPGNNVSAGNGDLDIVNLLTALARIQGKTIRWLDYFSYLYADQY